MLAAGGERQVATQLEEIRKDHRERYRWAIGSIGQAATAMDAGCGVGYGCHMVSEKVDRVVGVDISAESIDYAMRYWKNDKISFSIQDLHRLHFEDGDRFDVVTAFECLEHLAVPEFFLVGLRSFLNPGAVIFVSSPNERVVSWERYRNPFHFRHFTDVELRQLLETSGFEVEIICSQEDDGTVIDGTDGKYLLAKARMLPSETIALPETEAFYDTIVRRLYAHASIVGIDSNQAKQDRNSFRDEARKLQGIEAKYEKLQRDHEALQEPHDDLQKKLAALEAELKVEKRITEVISPRFTELESEIAKLKKVQGDHRHELDRVWNSKVFRIGRKIKRLLGLK